jgi:hypothetical protein
VRVHAVVHQPVAGFFHAVAVGNTVNNEVHGGQIKSWWVGLGDNRRL